MTGDLLNAMVASARTSARERARTRTAASVERAAAAAAPRGQAFEAALSGHGIRIIAECKRRSPSRGVLRPDYDAAAIARSYEAAGAAAISVLTEPSFFDGSLDDLRAVRAAVSIPVMRKDFIVDEYQIAEAAADGADAVLLIVAALQEAELRRLVAAATARGLAVLVEAHDAAEVARAADAGARVIGVNSRNLRTLEVDTGVLDHLAPRIPHAALAVAESGLRSAADVLRLRARRYDAFLIGERFMTAADPGAALAALRSAADGDWARPR